MFLCVTGLDQILWIWLVWLAI